MATPPEGFAGIDASVPNIARMQDYYLGGTNNFEADRVAAEQVLRLIPSIRAAAIENRQFLRVAVRYLARRAGITQFIDIGPGLPTNGATHEVAQAVRSGARIAYVDYDPAVIAHASALLAGNDAAIAVTADLRQPADLLADPEIRQHLDFGRPIAVLLLGILHFIADDYIPGIITALRDALAPGSYVVITHIGGYVTRRTTAEEGDAALRVYAAAGQPAFPARRGGVHPAPRRLRAHRPGGHGGGGSTGRARRGQRRGHRRLAPDSPQELTRAPPSRLAGKLRVSRPWESTSARRSA